MVTLAIVPKELMKPGRQTLPVTAATNADTEEP